jgi:hypothetical protein
VADAVHDHIFSINTKHGAVITLANPEPPSRFSLERRDAGVLFAWCGGYRV